MVYEQWMADYDSPILGLKLGSEYTVVVLNYALVRYVNTHPEFEGRPDNFFFQLRTMGQRRGISLIEGQFWTEQRSFVTQHLRLAGYGREPMDQQIGQELSALLHLIAELKSKPVWPGSFLATSVLNVLWSITAGTQLSRSDPRMIRLLNLMQERCKAFDETGGVLNTMPWIRHVAPEWSGFNLINRFNREMHALLMETIAEHKADYTEKKAADDLIYAFIKEMRSQQQSKQCTHFTDSQLIMLMVDLFIAGSQETSISLDLAIMTLALYPKVQTRVYAELMQSQLTDDLPKYSDRMRMPYTHAVLHEVHRFYDIFPLAGPRRTLRETTLAGYTIPKHTTILMGNRQVHMDADHWGDPAIFRPERFLDADMNIVNTERLIPFGAGRRKCLGEQLARNCMFTYFVGIVQRFAVELPASTPGVEHPRPQRELQPGMVHSAKPYHVVFRSR